MNQKQNVTINFMGHRKTAAGVSIAFLLAAVVGLFLNGLNLGLDFTGGTQARVAFDRGVDLDTVREVVMEEGFISPVVVHYGSESEVMIRFQGSLDDIAITRLNAILAREAPGAAVKSVVSQAGNYQSRVLIQGDENLSALASTLFPESLYGQVDVRDEGDGTTAFLLGRSVTALAAESFVQALEEATGSNAQLKDLSYVGSQVGDQMAENAVIGLLTALGMVMLYVSFRFQYKFAIGAVAGLTHDVLIIVGVFSIFRMNVDLTVLAAVLAVIGYSINDTIVVSDRIRENFRKLRKDSPIGIINVSLNQTVGRTVVTSLTTLLVLLALFFLGGEVIRGFSLALIIGVVVGTYSSIYVTTNLLLALHISKEDLMVPIKEGADSGDS